MSVKDNGEARSGAFDTDADALARRIDAHARFGTRELDPWVLELLELAPGQRILELGCGTGKQTLPMADRVGRDGRVVAIDASPQALEVLGAAAIARRLADRLTLRFARFDDVSTLEGVFDRVVSCYALYYTRDPARLFEVIEAALGDDGLFFFCGPSEQNNAELLQFCANLQQDGGGNKRGCDPVIEFMERTGFELARTMFDNVERLEFENALRFDSPEAVLMYWRSYNLYDPSLEARFRKAIEGHFTSEPVFETVKRVRAVRARKRTTQESAVW